MARIYMQKKYINRRVLSIVKIFLYRVFCGFFLGVSIFAPGFSGSIVAILMGIYQDLLRIAAAPFHRLKQNVVFCFPLAIGAAVSAVLFVIALNFLFVTYEKATYLLFAGLIAGNLPIIYAEIKKSDLKRHYLIGGAGAFAAALTLGVLASGNGPVPGGESIIASSLPFLALSGFVAGITAVIPGMSVSMVLIIMGVYGQILFAAESLLHMDFTYLTFLGLFGVCAIIGLVFTSRGVKTIFEKFPGLANSMVFGFMAGSLIGVFIRSLRIEDANFTWLSGIIIAATGLGASMLFVVIGKAMRNK